MNTRELCAGPVAVGRPEGRDHRLGGGGGLHDRPGSSARHEHHPPHRGLGRITTIPAPSRLTTALLSLPEEFRMAIYYADVEGFSYAEIADIMGTPIGTVMSRLYRGRTRLRQSLSTLATERRVLRPTPQCVDGQRRVQADPGTRKIPLNRGHVEQNVDKKDGTAGHRSSR